MCIRDSTSEDWITDYEHRYTAARLSWKEKVLADAKTVDNPFDAYAANPFVLPQGRPVALQDLIEATAAIYVISRISGEGKDRTPTAGDYLLSDREMADLRTLDEAGLPLVLVLNAGGPVELTDLLAEYRHPLAVLQISQPGQQGGEAVTDILLGKAVPVSYTHLDVYKRQQGGRQLPPGRSPVRRHRRDPRRRRHREAAPRPGGAAARRGRPDHGGTGIKTRRILPDARCV